MKYAHGRATATPGKHGPGDWKVEFASPGAPTHAETLFMLGAKYIAEDRYNKPWNQGRLMLLEFVNKLESASSMEDVQAIANECAVNIRRYRQLRSVPEPLC